MTNCHYQLSEMHHPNYYKTLHKTGIKDDSQDKKIPPDSLSVTGGLFSCLSKDNLLLGVKLVRI